MSVQRYVDTGFWDDAWVETIQPLERYLYLYLITNPLTNIAGVYKITLRRIHNDTGLEIPEIERILALFAKAGKAYLHGEYIVLLLAHTITSLTITGWAPGRISKCTLDIRFQDDVDIGDWGDVNWEGGDPPNLTALTGRKDVISLYSPDGGGNIFGNIIGLDYRIA